MVGWDSVIVYLCDIDFSPMDGLAPCGAVDVDGFPMDWMAAELGMG